MAYRFCKNWLFGTEGAKNSSRDAKRVPNGGLKSENPLSQQLWHYKVQKLANVEN